MAETGEQRGERLQPVLSVVGHDSGVAVLHRTAVRGSDETRRDVQEEVDAGSDEVGLDCWGKETDSDDQFFQVSQVLLVTQLWRGSD